MITPISQLENSSSEKTKNVERYSETKQCMLLRQFVHYNARFDVHLELCK